MFPLTARDRNGFPAHDEGFPLERSLRERAAIETMEAVRDVSLLFVHAAS